MRALAILLAGCWSAAPPVVVDAPKKQRGPCVIRDRAVSAMRPVALSIEGETFTGITHSFDELDLAVTGDSQVERARLETSELILEGDLDLATFPFRLRDPAPWKNWVEVETAHVLAPTGYGRARIEVELPAGVMPRTVAFEVRCADLTVEEKPPVEERAHVIEDRMIARPTTLLNAWDGYVLAKIVPNRAAPIRAEVFETHGRMLLVGLSEPNAVIGWIPMSATEDWIYSGLGSAGQGIVARTHSRIECPKPTPIYVTTKSVREVRVGTLKAKARVGVYDAAADKVVLDLGEAAIKAYLRTVDLAACSR